MSPIVAALALLITMHDMPELQQNPLGACSKLTILPFCFTILGKTFILVYRHSQK